MNETEAMLQYMVSMVAGGLTLGLVFGLLLYYYKL